MEQRKARTCKAPPQPRQPKPQSEKLEVQRAAPEDFSELQDNYEALERSKLGVLAHVASQHSVLDVLYGGDTGKPMPPWTHQTTPEVGVSDQQHTGRCWIFATLAVLGHVFRSQYGISNHRATFSEAYLGFWDLYEKSRLFLNVAYDTRCTPLDDPSLSDLLKGGISDGGDYIFCLNLLDRYGIVPTEYYPNSSYGSMSTEALVTLLNQVLRDNVITLRNTGDESLIGAMMTNVFAILCMGLGTPPMPWKKLDWHVDQYETMASFAAQLGPASVGAAVLPGQNARAVAASAAVPTPAKPWGPIPPPIPEPQPVVVPTPPPPPASSSMADILSAFGPTPEPTMEEAPPPPLPEPASIPLAASIMQATEAPPLSPTVPDSSASVIVEEDSPLPTEPELAGTRPPRPTVDISARSSSPPCMDISSAGACGQRSGLARFIQPFRRCGNSDVPAEGSADFFAKDMSPRGCGGAVLGNIQRQPCRLGYEVPKPKVCKKSEKPREEETLSFDYTPRDFYYRYLNSIRFVPVVCDPRFPAGTRIISNDANMFGGLPSLYLNITIDDIEAYTIASLKRNVPVWFACDVKKQLTPEGGRMCNHTDRLAELLPEPHERGTKLEEIRHFNAIANHALLITAVSIKDEKPVAWRVVNSWGEVGRNAGVFVACGDWFREHVYAINALYDTMKKSHKADLDLRQPRPTIRLGPFDPSVI